MCADKAITQHSALTCSDEIMSLGLILTSIWLLTPSLSVQQYSLFVLSTQQPSEESSSFFLLFILIRNCYDVLKLWFKQIQQTLFTMLTNTTGIILQSQLYNMLFNPFNYFLTSGIIGLQKIV